MSKQISKNPLTTEITKLIKHNTFITLDEFIKLCLFHPNYGYYQKKIPIGKEEDFTTAPEISQLFGEMLGFWVIKQWQDLGKPNKLNLIELGPGNGTLMLDLLNLVKKIPELYKAITVYFIEINKLLQKKQKQKLDIIIKDYPLNINWLNNLDQLENSQNYKEAPLIIIANEFLDVFQAKQFKYKNNNWHEVLVTLSDEQHSYSLALSKTSSNLNHLLPKDFIPNEDMIFEYSPTALGYFKAIMSLILKNQGAAIFIDYGYTKNNYTNTIQALSKHKFADFLTNHGENDITHLVNFPLLISQLQDTSLTYNISTQKQFLTNLGIEQRLSVLLKIANSAQKSDIILGSKRILDEKDMGSLFKVLEITSS